MGSQVPRAQRREPVLDPLDPGLNVSSGLFRMEAVLHSISYTVLHRQIQAMENAFRLGLDPHLVTAMDLARRSGVVPAMASMDEVLSGKDDRQGSLLCLGTRPREEQASHPGLRSEAVRHHHSHRPPPRRDE
jgi:hypothetical protein